MLKKVSIFVAGYTTCFLVFRNSLKIRRVLEKKIATLELRRDILKHDNPEL